MTQHRQLAVIMFTDIVGYSSLMQKDEAAALYSLEMNRQIIKAALEQHNGHWTKEVGDGTLSTFKSTIDALNCAIKILSAIKEFPQLNLRIALHLGDIIEEDADIFGDVVNIASRIEHLAPTNGIAVTQHFHAQLQGKTNYQFTSIGFPQLKNLTPDIEVFIWEPSKPITAISSIEKNVNAIKNKSNFAKPLLSALVFFLIVSVIFLNFNNFFPDKASKEIMQNEQESVIGIEENSIAVLKFRSIGDVKNNQYFGEGLSEELLNLLARIKELKVASRTSSWAISENTTTEAIRNQLLVNYLVEGSVRKSADKVRITVQLIETKTGFHLWSETYDRKVHDVIAIQDEIAQNITNSLKLLLSAQSIKSLTTTKHIDEVAYDHYLKAKNYLRQSKTNENLNAAIQGFELALAIESDFELAYAGLCQSQIERYKITHNQQDFIEAESHCLKILPSNSYQNEIYNSLGTLYLVSGNNESALANFQSALTLDLNSIDALIGLGRTNNYLDKTELARSYFNRAISTAPNSSEAHQNYASFLFHQGESLKAIDAYKKVIALTPKNADAFNGLGVSYFASGNLDKGVETFHLSLSIKETQEAYSNLGTVYYMNKQFQLAVNMYQKAIKLAPYDYLFWGFLGESLERISGKENDMQHAFLQAIKYAKQSVEVNRNDTDVLVSLALYYAKTQQKDEAIKILIELENQNLLPEMLYMMSVSYLSINEQDSALTYLQKALEQGYDKEAIRLDENFAVLSKNDRFINLLKNS